MKDDEYGKRSAPWADQDFVYLDGSPCMYFLRNRQVFIVRPGQKPVKLDDIRDLYHVIEPERWRVSCCPQCGGVRYTTRV